MLAILLDFLDDAQSMQPQRRENCQGSQGLHLEEPGKEPFGPACRDYFWVLCRLVESLQVKEETAQYVDIESLAHRLCCGISTRQVTNNFMFLLFVRSQTSVFQQDTLFVNTRLIIPSQFYERRQGGNTATSDDALVRQSLFVVQKKILIVSLQVGMLTLMSAVLKHNPVFKHQPEGQVFVATLFEFLFKLPSSQVLVLRHFISKWQTSSNHKLSQNCYQEKLHPVCKSQLSRTACYDLLGELVRGCAANYTALHQLLIAQHQVEEEDDD